MQTPSRSARLVVFFQRLDEHALFAGETEAYRGCEDVLNRVEDELTGVAYCPANWATDGRLYWPQPDRAWRINENVVLYEALGHLVYIGSNGSIEIVLKRRRISQYRRAGRDGKHISEFLSPEERQ